MILEWKMGMRWRQERAARNRRREELQEEKTRIAVPIDSPTPDVGDEEKKRGDAPRPTIKNEKLK